MIGMVSLNAFVCRHHILIAQHLSDQASHDIVKTMTSRYSL